MEDAPSWTGSSWDAELIFGKLNFDTESPRSLMSDDAKTWQNGHGAAQVSPEYSNDQWPHFYTCSDLIVWLNSKLCLTSKNNIEGAGSFERAVVMRR